MEELMVAVLILLLVVAVLGTSLVLAVVALARSRKISKLASRLEQLEALVHSLPTAGPSGPVLPAEPGPAPPAAAAEPVSPIAVSEVAAAPLPLAPDRPSVPQAGDGWELAIGRKVLGWAAVVVLLFAAAFFVRYAFENQWIGPAGRVALGAAAGLVLVCGGWHYHRRGWQVSAQMLTAGGIVLLYLVTYSAFGFYHLVPARAAAVLLLILVAEFGLLAMQYDAPAIAMMAVVGGLLTPVLMRTERDQYVALFTYLSLLDAGVLLLVLRKHWAAIATVALLGTQALFWGWYGAHYHPEKLAWAIGFQAVVFALFLVHGLAAPGLGRRRASNEDLVRLILNPLLGFVAAYVLLNEDYHVWMGTLAVSMALVYAGLGRLMLALRPRESRQLLAVLAVAIALTATAIPIQAEAHWIALGWMAEAAALWWFGLRVQSPPMRCMAAVLAALAVGRLVFVDTPFETRQLFWPIFNHYALPALGAAACLLAAVAATRRFLGRLAAGERVAVAAAGAGGVLLVWMILSVDVYGYFAAEAAFAGYPESARWHWLGGMSLSALWAVYATVLLAAGFRASLTMLRWIALGLYALTVGKVFLVDMAELREFYRILAFFILAMFLGAAAWAYQRIRPRAEVSVPSEETRL